MKNPQKLHPQAKAQLLQMVEDGELVEDRAANPASLRSLYVQTRDNYEQTTGSKIGPVISSLNGNPPWTDAELREMSQGHRTNVNFLGMEKVRREDVESRFKLTLGQPEPVKIILHGKGSTRYAGHVKCLQSAIARALKYTPFYFRSMIQQLNNFAIAGTGHLWHPPGNWTWSTCPVGTLLTPPGTSYGEDEQVFFYQRKFAPQDLVKNLKADGWNADYILDILARHESPHIKHGESYYRHIQNRIRNGDWGTTTGNPRITLVSCLVRQMDNKLKHVIIDPEGENEFVFEAESTDSDLHEWMTLVFGQSITGEHGGERGICQASLSTVVLDNRLKSALTDHGFDQLTTYVQGAPNGETPTRTGSYVMLPQGGSLPPNRYSGSVNSALAIISMLNATENALVRSRAGVSEDLGQQYYPRSAAEVNAAYEGQAGVNITEAEWYYAQMDNFWSVICTRLLNADKSDPVRKQISRFMDVEQYPLEETLSIMEDFLVDYRCNRAIGQGSTREKRLALSNVAAIYSRLSPEGRKLYDQLVIETSFGPSEVKQFLDMNPQGSGGIDANFAMLESMMISSTGMPLPAPMEHDPLVHVPVHIQAMSLIMESDDPVKAAQATFQHIEEHLGSAQQDPRIQNEISELAASFEAAGKELMPMIQQWMNAKSGKEELSEKAKLGEMEIQVKGMLEEKKINLAHKAQLMKDGLLGQLKVAQSARDARLEEERQQREGERLEPRATKG